MTILRSAFVVAGLTLLTSGSALAEQPAWVPEGIALPDDHEIVSDRSIGSGTHMLKAEVAEDPTALLQAWSDDLQKNGFETDTDAIEDGRILFSGPDGVQGQVVTTQAFEADGFIIEIDMSGG